MNASCWPQGVEKVVAAPAAIAFLGRKPRLAQKSLAAGVLRVAARASRKLLPVSGGFDHDRRRDSLTGESWYANADALAANNPEEIISYTYNAAGDITSESDFNCAQSAVVSADYYTYNSADQLTAVVETIAGGPAVQLSYTYNDAGECSGVTASIGGSVDSSGDYSGGSLDYQNTYGYDANGELTRIIQSSQTGGNAVASKEIDFTYNPAGQFQSITRYENGQLVAETDYTYNSAGQLTSLVHEQGSSVLASYAYTYGAGTALASAVQPVVPSVWTPSGATLPFDDPSQIDLSSLDQAPSPASLLASVTSVDGTATYSYDAMGEILSASYTGGQSGEMYSWDANGNPSGSGYVIGPDNELLSDGTYNYAYNADGDCTSRTDIATGAETLYTWDARNRLVGVTDETSADQITQTVTYVYDVENRCVGETVTAYSGGNPSSVHTTDYAYDGNQIVLQFDATSTPGTAVTLTANNLSHRYLNGPAVDQVMCDERVTLQNGALATDEVLWPLADAQGTVRDVAKLTGTTAAVVDHIMYNSFGGVVSESDPSQGVLFKSTGCFTDPATDIEFHEERPKIAGSVDWLKVDPSGETSGTTNLYDYCGNDPINATDPSGLQAPAPPDLPPGSFPYRPLTRGDFPVVHRGLRGVAAYTAYGIYVGQIGVTIQVKEFADLAAAEAYQKTLFGNVHIASWNAKSKAGTLFANLNENRATSASGAVDVVVATFVPAQINSTTVFAYFDRNRAYQNVDHWRMINGRMSDETLNHENRHLQIAEVFALALASEYDSYSASIIVPADKYVSDDDKASVNRDAERLLRQFASARLQDYVRAMNTIERRYDVAVHSQTNAQNAWNATLDKALADAAQFPTDWQRFLPPGWIR
jgi:RHS repeat-associated protein